MRYSIIIEPFAIFSRAYGFGEFEIPDFEKLFYKSKRYLGFRPDLDWIVQVLGLNGENHLSSNIKFSGDKTHPIDPRMFPLERTIETDENPLIQLVRTYGRGYVVPEVKIERGNTPIKGGLAVKGTGLEGWAKDNKSWMVEENQHRGVVAGSVPEDSFVRDIVGEAWAIEASLYIPIFVYATKHFNRYRIARFWKCPYRIWELSSVPFRVGPDASQSILLMNWRVELYFAMAFKDRIRIRATECIGQISDSNLPKSWLENFRRRIITNIARLTAAEFQLLPNMFHLANISYEGETSGFDRILGPRKLFSNFALGILNALIETWTATGWVSIVLGIQHETFDKFFSDFKDILSSLKPDKEVSSFFLRKDSVSKIYNDTYGKALNYLLKDLLFSFRFEDDIKNLLNSISIFLQGLNKIYSGDIQTIDKLEQWEMTNNFIVAEKTRIQHDVGGDYLGGDSSKFQKKLQMQINSSKIYVSLLSEIIGK